jgi:hypothetical protein
MVVNNVTSRWVNNVASLVGVFAIFIFELPFGFVNKIANNIAFFISFEISYDITFIKPSGLRRWWHFNNIFFLLLFKVVKGVIFHKH